MSCNEKIPASTESCKNSSVSSMRDKLAEEFSRIYPQYESELETGKDQRDLDWELCNRGLLPEKDLLAAYAKCSSIACLDEEEFEIPEALEGICVDFLKNSCCVPMSMDGGKAVLALADPYLADQLHYFFKKFYGLDTSFILARRSVLERIIDTVYGTAEAKNEEENLLELESSEEMLRNLASEATVVRFVNDIFSRAVEMDASDIHIEPEEDEFAVRLRVDGILQKHVSGPKHRYPAIASRIKLIGGLNIAESRLPQDGRTNLQIGRSEIDVRISTIPVMNGESLVLRILRKDIMDFSLESIGMRSEMLSSFRNIISSPHGIILVVGPTGSGKTTTLYSVMTKLNDEKNKIITIEDPVEYRIRGLSQMQVNPKIGLNFANGLRNIVRQDPDVILVGEIRDRETADIAINAALTGHLVLSTLHTNDAPGAISRLLDMGAESFLISSSLVGVLSQRLVRKVCPECGGKALNTDHKCRKCRNTGFKGRTGIFELLVVNDKIRSLINSEADSSTIAKAAVQDGMLPLMEDGKRKVREGITTEPEITRAAKIE